MLGNTIRSERSSTTESDIVLRDPRTILWTQQTTATTFSEGAPDPATGRKKPGQNILTVARDLRRGKDSSNNKVSYEDFAPLTVFGLVDPDTGEANTYSLSNRRLTMFREAGATQVKTRPAKFEEIYSELWKLTNVDGGYSQPKATNLEKHKERLPEEYTTLGKFRRDIERSKSVVQRNCQGRGITDPAEIEKRALTRIEPKAREKYKLF